MSKRTKNQELSTKNSAAKPSTKHQEPITKHQELVIPIIELDLPEATVDHLVEQGINTLNDLIEFSRDGEAMEAVLESDARQQVLSLVASYETDASDNDSPEPDAAPSDRSLTATQRRAASSTSNPTALPESAQAKLSASQAASKPAKNKSEASAATGLRSETSSSLQSPASSLIQQPPPSDLSDDLDLQRTDAEIRREFLEEIRKKAEQETDERLPRMLARAKMDNDIDIVHIVNAEIDKRFETSRQTQRTCTIEVCYSDLQRRGYSASQESVSRFLHRQRLTHEAGVALARIHLAMKEGGVKLRNGKRVTSKSHVIQKLLELAYESINRR